MKQKIILATTSPRRHGIAQIMGLEFDIVPSNYDEDMTLNLSPKELVKKFAYGKALDVAKRFKKGIVIGVDTIAVFRGRNLGKPKNKANAIRMLKSFSNKKQQVYSGVALIDCATGKAIKDYEMTELQFRKLSDFEIKKYVATGKPLDKAGAYGIQDLASIFIKKINGCYFNVMGFPVYNIYKNLKKMKVNIFQYEGWRGRN
ncbi:MAG: septum formation protein Maf [Nanoarchaeota archaeon]|nr:septum formation protein Maf [Nanoarchaeota archaeon]